MQDTDKPYQAKATKEDCYPFPSERFEATVLVGDNCCAQGNIRLTSIGSTILIVLDDADGMRQVIPMSAVRSIQFQVEPDGLAAAIVDTIARLITPGVVAALREQKPQ